MYGQEGCLTPSSNSNENVVSARKEDSNADIRKA
jgi:hypothetical protein